MSGHSKWHNIKHTKNKKDAKRSKMFSKLSANIANAVRKGGDDPEKNADLGFAIDKAKEKNMPKDTIKRAIKRGKGELGGKKDMQVIYEGFGPGGIGIIIEATTDNKNRTVANLRKIFSKHGGNLGEKNSVLWKFEKKGYFEVLNKELEKKGLNREEFELNIIDAGVEDIKESDNSLKIYTGLKAFNDVKKAINDLDISIDQAKLAWFAKNYKEVSQEDKKKLDSLLNELNNTPGVDRVFTNLKK